MFYESVSRRPLQKSARPAQNFDHAGARPAPTPAARGKRVSSTFNNDGARPVPANVIPIPLAGCAAPFFACSSGVSSSTGPGIIISLASKPRFVRRDPC